MRSASMQFHWFATRRDASAYLARAGASGDSYGDRVAAERRLEPVTTRAEREAARAFNECAALERFQKFLRGEWPARGPIILRPRGEEHG